MEGLRHPNSADWAGCHDGLLIDQQVLVGGTGPAVAPVVEPVQDDLPGEFVQRTRAAGDGESAIAQVDVVELKFGVRFGSGGVDGGQGDDKPVEGCADALRDYGDLLSIEGKGELAGVITDMKPAAGSWKTERVRLQGPKQRSKPGQRVMPISIVKGVEEGEEAIFVQQALLDEGLDGPADAEAASAKRGEQVRETDPVAWGVRGQRQDQGLNRLGEAWPKGC